ncbi:1995_t:CDS:10 [Rhizophagus irregularis]|nr:1995_t:CDS:10 [Rhizophagus irregularis]
MMLSLNCLILGQASVRSFTENICEKYYDDRNVEIEFSRFNVSHFKEMLFPVGQKRHADSEPVDTGPKRLKIVPTPELYPDSEQYVAGRFYKSKIPISGKDFIDMRLDNECTTDSGKYLLGKLRNAREGFYLLYAISGAGKTRTIFDIAMNNDEPTKDRNFKRLVDSIRSAFSNHNYERAREESKHLIYELRLEYENVDLVSIIESALDYLKNKLVGQKSLIFAIDEANVANKKLFYGDFRNSNGKPRGGIGREITSEYFTDFKTTESKDVVDYLERYLDLPDCDIKKIENSKYLVGRPRLVARLVREIINAEIVSREDKQIVLEDAVNKTVQSIKNDMTRHLEAIVKEAYEKEDLGNVELRKILMILFINCWFFDGYVSESEIDDYSAKLVDCGIASLKSDKDKIFWQVKEPLAIEVVKAVLFSRHHLVIGRLMDFNNKTVFEFVNEIYGYDQLYLPNWTKKAIIDIESYGNVQMFSQLDVKLKDDVDVIKSLLYESIFSKYMLVPGHLVRPDGIYISKLNIDTYWTLLISTKMYTSKLSGKGVDDDKNSTDWSLLYHKKNGEVTCKNLKERLDDVRQDFTCQGSLRIHFILPGVAQERTSNQSSRSNRGGCFTENNDVIMYIDEKLLERYFKGNSYIKFNVIF